MDFYCTAGFIKRLCSLLVSAMWPISGTFFRYSGELCSQVSSRINDRLYCFRGEPTKERTTSRACGSLCYVEGRSPEK